MDADSEFIIICPTCGDRVDKRNLSQVLSHGWLNPDSGQYECGLEVKIPFSLAMKVGDTVQWTEDLKRIDLN
jgi:hypothetical protein